MNNFLLCVVALFGLLALSHASVPVTKDMKTFGTAIKNGFLPPNSEETVFEHSCSQGVVTEQWYTGFDVMDERTRVRVYINGEAAPSLDYMLLLAHGIGSAEAAEKANLPWGTHRMAHAADGGIYNTYRIPFQGSIKITVWHPVGGTFWYIVRGVENYPVIIGDLQFPDNSRLQLIKNENVSLKPLEYVTLANLTGTAGALYQVTLSAVSTDFNYLEACMRAYIDGATTPMFLSSGTEDYFLSAYYFDAGLYHLPNAGLTYIDGNNATMSAYKLHENDPVLFSSAFALQWRCGEDAACPTKWPPSSSPSAPAAAGASANGRPVKGKYGGNLAGTNITTYTWIYTYSF